MEDVEGLRRELLAVDGVVGAEITTVEESVAGVKVRVDPEVDAATVGRSVQEVLARHGVAAAVAGSTIASGGPPPPPGGGSVVAIADFEHSASRPGVVADAALEGVGVEESTEGVLVTARTADGRRATQQALRGEEGVAEALASAIAALLEVPAPRLLGYRDDDVGGARVITVALETAGGRRIAGAAVVAGGVPYAVAQAVWRAIESGP